MRFILWTAQLTYWLGQIIKNKSNSCILLVDRSSHRHKSDNKLKREESHLIIKRIRADIADLQLNQIVEIQPVKYKVGVAKHLCGTATGTSISSLSLADKAPFLFCIIVDAYNDTFFRFSDTLFGKVDERWT